MHFDHVSLTAVDHIQRSTENHIPKLQGQALWNFNTAGIFHSSLWARYPKIVSHWSDGKEKCVYLCLIIKKTCLILHR